MSEETLNEALAVLVNKAVDGIDTSVSFLQQEIPDVVQQLLMWEFVYNFLFFLMAVVFTIILVLADRILYKKGTAEGGCMRDECGELEEEFWIGYIMIGTILRVVGWTTFVIIPLNLTWLKIWIAPKVFLIEYSANLIK